jgi:tetratricopeptide (TPR) repeat protein
MSETKLHTTKELEEHIRSVYSLLEAAAREDGVLDAYEPLTAFFGNGVFEKHQSYCYAARSCYYFCSFGDRGGLYEQATRDLFEITCMVISYKIPNMAMKYEHEHRIENQDNRRIRFEKELQYWNMLGPEYRKKREKEIEDSLFWNPHEDDPQGYPKKCSLVEETADECIGFFYDIAEESFERGAFKKAITYLTECLKLEPQSIVYEKRGELYRMLAEQTETPLKKKKYEKRAEKTLIR